MVDPTTHFIDDLDAQKSRAMDALTFEQRGWAGLGMFDLIGESIRSGIRMTHPDASEDEVHDLYLHRMMEVREGRRGA